MSFNIVATIKIMPDGVETDLEKIKNAIEGALPDNTQLHDTEVQPIAFGLNALIARVLLSDEGGVADTIEQNLTQIDGVREATIDDVRRLL